MLEEVELKLGEQEEGWLEREGHLMRRKTSHISADRRSEVESALHDRE